MSIDNIIDGFIAAIENRDTETISNFLDKNIVFENVPENHMILGCQGVKQMFANLFTKIMRIRWKIEHQLTHGNIAFIERKNYMYFRDKKIVLPVVSFIEINNEKITLFRDYYDAETLIKQLSK